MKEWNDHVRKDLEGIGLPYNCKVEINGGLS